jgi:hypothetical protein
MRKCLKTGVHKLLNKGAYYKKLCIPFPTEFSANLPCIPWGIRNRCCRIAFLDRSIDYFNKTWHNPDICQMQSIPAFSKLTYLFVVGHDFIVNIDIIQTRDYEWSMSTELLILAVSEVNVYCTLGYEPSFQNVSLRSIWRKCYNDCCDKLPSAMQEWWRDQILFCMYYVIQGYIIFQRAWSVTVKGRVLDDVHCKQDAISY